MLLFVLLLLQCQPTRRADRSVECADGKIYASPAVAGLYLKAGGGGVGVVKIFPVGIGVADDAHIIAHRR